MGLYPLQEHSLFLRLVERRTNLRLWKREEHTKVDWAGCEGPGGERGGMAVPDFQKAVYANEEGKAYVEGSAAADGTFEDSRGECVSTRRRRWRGKYRWWMDGRKEREASNSLV